MFQAIYDFTDMLWGWPLFILVAGTGLFLSIKTGFFQITGIKTWWKKTIVEALSKEKNDNAGEGELTPWQAILQYLVVQ